MRWVWVSTRQSMDSGHISGLAILETVITIAATMAVAFFYETATHIIVSATVAPFLLLGIPEAKNTGIRWFKPMERFILIVSDYDDKIQSKSILWLPIKILIRLTLTFIYLVVSPIYAITIRFSSTCLWVARRPLRCITNIPENWHRITLRTDIATTPEILPGYAASDPPRLFSFEMMVEENKKWMSSVKNIILTKRDFLKSIISFSFGIAGFFVLAMLFVPTNFYRYALKSTSVVFLPFIWIAGGFESGPNAKLKLETISKDEAIRRVYGWFVIFAYFIIPILAYSKWNQIIAWVDGHIPIEGKILGIWFFVYELHIWHLARLANAVLTIFIGRFANLQLRRIKYGEASPEKRILYVIRTVDVIRLVLTMYILVCTFYVFYTTVELPKLGDWFPSSE